MEKDIDEKSTRRGRVRFFLLYCIAGVVLNLTLAEIVDLMGIPAFADTAGTMSISMLGGMLPGVIVGFVTNAIKCITKSNEMYYAALNMLSAIMVSIFVRKGWVKKKLGCAASIAIITAVTATIGTVMTWFLHSADIGGTSKELALDLHESGLPRFWALYLSLFITELFDKGLSFIAALFMVKLVPEKVAASMPPTGRWQAPIDTDMAAGIKSEKNRVVSLRTKMLIILVAASVLVAGIAIVISFVLFKRSMKNDHIRLADGIATIVASKIDPEKVDAYMENGVDEPGYTETLEEMYRLKNSLPDIQYMYVYQIHEDGCHVVFDLDSDVQGSAAGDVVKFDESFMKLVPTLLKGRKIDPIVTDGAFGWLLTVYKPVYDKEGNCVCYACTDVSMNLLETYGYSFITKQVSLLIGFFMLILAVGLWLVEYNVIVPVNTMAYSAEDFAYNSDEARDESVRLMKYLNIRTGDEIENLYNAFVKTISESMSYVDDIQTKTETISKMQNGLIMVLADMVESRDKCTGDHVRKTVAYCRVILRQLKEKGYYSDIIDEEFTRNVMNAAPLHDIGKIQVSDTILNKPGKLTDEEFEIMKTHTTRGSLIIDRAIAMVPDSDYLTEAKNVAEFHHEKWNGKGYPHGLKGEEIPLSARIMAVADVFDALVSQRSYKKPFTVEKAMSIIREDAGTHFDPYVADAFLSAEDEVRRIADDHAKSFS